MIAILASAGLPLWLGATLVCMAIDAVADESTDVDEELDVEFLEYLGMWEETDEDWQVLEAEAVAKNEERNDPASDDEESVENSDES